jgi:hypothetical protein
MGYYTVRDQDQRQIANLKSKLDDLTSKLNDLKRTLTEEEYQTFDALRGLRTKLKRPEERPCRALRYVQRRYWSGDERPYRASRYDHVFARIFSSSELYEKDVAELRALANNPPKVSRRRRTRPVPPARDDRFYALRQQIYELQCDIQEDWDVQASPDALRYLADYLEHEIHRQREREQRERQQWERERQRQQRERERAERASRQPDPLEILNLKASATRDEINARYRALMKQLHPDTNAGSEAASGLLRQMMDAMETLRRQGRA